MAGDRSALAGKAVELPVVEHNRKAVAGLLHIAFDAHAGGDRRGEGGQGVFGIGAAMQAAVGVFAPLQPEGPRRIGRGGEPGIERRDQPQPTATIASTSTAAPSGSTGTPTALLACLPASPKTSAIRSEAPLATLG